VFSITLVYVPLDLILPDQPNRALRTRMLRGVGGAPCEGCPYPDRTSISRQVYVSNRMAPCCSALQPVSECNDPRYNKEQRKESVW